MSLFSLKLAIPTKSPVGKKKNAKATFHKECCFRNIGQKNAVVFG